MSRGCRIFLIIVVVLVVLALCACVLLFSLAGSFGWLVSRGVSTAPLDVESVAAQIAEFSLPAGYRPEASALVLGVAWAYYLSGDRNGHIMFLQLPASVNLDQARLERELWRAARSGDGADWAGLRKVGERQATIRGQPVTLTISEGTSGDNGDPFRALAGIFQGKGGRALLVISEPIAGWNDARIDTFLASLR